MIEWEQPKGVFEISSFLGSGSYYRRFVKGFSLIAGPLTKLLLKNAPFVWSNKQQANFEKHKPVLTQTSILVQAKFGKKFVVYSDASHIGLGCVLMQIGKVVAYVS